MRLFGLALLCMIASASVAIAEYRVALIIGEESGSARIELESLGFRCESSPSLSEKELRRRIEAWASTTPTNSTALIHFSGEVKREKEALCLISNNDRPLAVATVFDILSKRGGSRKNCLVATAAASLELKVELPDDCYFGSSDVETFAKENGITGRGSTAVSPPDKFVLGKKAGDEWVNARGMVFCWCPPGKYIAGSPPETPGRFDDEAPREVVIKEGFWIGKYEHTRGQKLRNLSNKMIGDHKNHPVNQLHWDDGSRMVINTLSTEERKAGRLPADWQYSLPTEEQWEYAARAGTGTRFYFGDDLDLLPQHANFADKSSYDSGDIYSNHAHRTLDDGFARLAPVGSFRPNPWGLHDVYGNVTEWCIDHGARGGSWVSLAENCRSAYRDSYSSRNEQNYLGYRFVIQKTPAQSKMKK